MKIIEPYVDGIIFHIPEDCPNIEAWLEKCGRTCYKSEDKITEESAPKFIAMLRDRGHHAMLEHAMASVRIVADRGLTHELVRHRIASFAQESTRYCNYGKGKFGSEITVVDQGDDLIGEAWDIWRGAMERAEKAYLELIDHHVSPQLARSVLPIGLKSEIVISANLREFRHIFSMRCDRAAHPIIRKIFLQILEKFYKKIPALYEDLYDKFVIEV